MEVSGTELALIAVVAAFGLIGVVAIDIIAFTQHAEAGCQNGLPNSAPALDASKLRCFR